MKVLDEAIKNAIKTIKEQYKQPIQPPIYELKTKSTVTVDCPIIVVFATGTDITLDTVVSCATYEPDNDEIKMAVTVYPYPDAYDKMKKETQTRLKELLNKYDEVITPTYDEKDLFVLNVEEISKLKSVRELLDEENSRASRFFTKTLEATLPTRYYILMQAREYAVEEDDEKRAEILEKLMIDMANAIECTMASIIFE